MSSPDMSSKPSYIYKILPGSAAPPIPLPKSLPVSELDRDSGFIHLSTARQVLKTLELFFAEELVVYILRLEYTAVESHVKWERAEGGRGDPGAVGVFPHLYNGNHLGEDEVESVSVVHNDGEDWEKALCHINIIQKDWLIF